MAQDAESVEWYPALRYFGSSQKISWRLRWRDPPLLLTFLVLIFLDSPLIFLLWISDRVEKRFSKYTQVRKLLLSATTPGYIAEWPRLCARRHCREYSTLHRCSVTAAMRRDVIAMSRPEEVNPGHRRGNSAWHHCSSVTACGVPSCLGYLAGRRWQQWRATVWC